MAKNPLAILSVDELKAELRIEADDNEQDALLTSYIEAGVAFVEDKTAQPLVERKITRKVIPCGRLEPIRFKIPQYKSIDTIAFWSPDANPYSEPDGVVGKNAVGRVERVPDTNSVDIYPSADGWPTTHIREPHLRVTFIQGVNFTSERTKSLKQAVRSVAQKLYDGETDYTAVDRLLVNWQRYD